MYMIISQAFGGIYSLHHRPHICKTKTRFMRISNTLYDLKKNVLKTRINAYQRNVKFMNVHKCWDTLAR